MHDLFSANCIFQSGGRILDLAGDFLSPTLGLCLRVPTNLARAFTRPIGLVRCILDPSLSSFALTVGWNVCSIQVYIFTG